MGDDPKFSRFLYGFCWSENMAVEAFVDLLMASLIPWVKEVKKRQRLRIDDYRQHLKHFTLEAFKVYSTKPHLYIAVPRKKAAYTNPGKPRSHYFHLSYDHSRLICDFLIAEDYFELYGGDKMGWKDETTGIGFRTRMRGTEKLINMMNGFGINRFMIVDYPYKQPEIIIQRSKKKKGETTGKEINYKDDEFTINARRHLQFINKFLAANDINLYLTDAEQEDLEKQMYMREDKPNEDNGKYTRYLDFTNKPLRRIFNNGSFGQGGRFYGGWWQAIPSKYRNLITINGKKTVEIDYSGMHFAIMYAQKDMEVPMPDPYAVEELSTVPRKQIKKAFNAIINCDTEEKAIGLVDSKIKSKEWSEGLLGGKELLRTFKSIHEPISDMIATGHGLKAQFYDSEIAKQVMLWGVMDGLCILPVHDSFIIRAGEGETLKQYMVDAFKKTLGRQPNLDFMELKGMDLVKSNCSIISTAVLNNGEELDISEGMNTPKNAIGFGQMVGLGDLSIDDLLNRGMYEDREHEWRIAYKHI